MVCKYRVCYIVRVFMARTCCDVLDVENLLVFQCWTNKYFGPPTDASADNVSLLRQMHHFLRAMADAAERYIQHREWVLELERTKFGNGELEDGSENENDENREYQDARPRSLKVCKSMRAIHRDFVARLNLDRAMARGISLRRSLWARPWIYPKADRKVRRLWQSAKKVELFDTFISHVWSTSWRMKFTSLVLQSCWIFMLTSWAIVATLVFFLCFFDVLPLDWRYDAEALGDIVQCQLGPWIVGFSMPACLLLGGNQVKAALQTDENWRIKIKTIKVIDE